MAKIGFINVLALKATAQPVFQAGTPAYDKAVKINKFIAKKFPIDVEDISELSHLSESDLDYCLGLIDGGATQEQILIFINF